MHKFLDRLWVSIILIVVVIAVIYFIPVWAFAGVIAFFIAMAQLEFFYMMQNKGVTVYKYFGTAVGVLLPVAIYLRSSMPLVRDSEPLLIVIASMIVFVLQFLRKDGAKDHVISVAVTVLSLLYISWFFSFFVKLRLLNDGANLVAFLILVTKSADIGAYLIGSRWGLHELIPRISPKKTKEGSIGGIAFSMVVAVIAGRYLVGVSMPHLLVLGLLIATLGQVGDLAESLIKRNSDVKDSGAYLNGIGGFLDLIDSLLFTAPVFYFYMITL